MRKRLRALGCAVVMGESEPSVFGFDSACLYEPRELTHLGEDGVRSGLSGALRQPPMATLRAAPIHHE